MPSSVHTEQAEGSFDYVCTSPEPPNEQDDVSDADSDIESTVSYTPLVQTLYEGPRKCGCCINWVDYLPESAEDSPSNTPDVSPIVLRHTVTRGEDTSRVSLQSIEIRDPAARSILCRVFEGFDRLNPSINYLVFHAPFKPFFYRWDEFVAACASEASPILEELHDIVKEQLSEAFAIRDELVANGVVSFPYLWTVFQPGEFICEDEPAGGKRFYYLEELHMRNRVREEAELWVRFVDYNGGFTLTETEFVIQHFQGTRKITELPVYPARFLPDPDAAKEAAVARGRKFASLAGVHYKEYADSGEAGSEGYRRIVVDSQGGRYPKAVPPPIPPVRDMARDTGGITQVPPDAPPLDGHISIKSKRREEWGSTPDGEADYPVVDPPYSYPPPPPPHPARQPRDYASQRRRGYRPRPPRSWRTPPQGSAVRVDDGEKGELDEFHLQLCTNVVEGFCLKNRKWQMFYVDNIRDVEWNPDPFSTLVLPDGYKDLVLSFVESHVGGGQQPAGDVVRGKGSGLVVSLTGPPGVGKTLTAESVAEVLKVPLYVVDLGQVADELEDAHLGRPVPVERDGRPRLTIEDAFAMAARWKALLLVDECDLYLEPRSESTPVRNRVVTKFLREIEYSSSLVFMTTNRPDALDPAIASRVHLTVAYPQLDSDARGAIWETLLAHHGARALGDSRMRALADLELNGRRIRNVVKAAAIMAGRNKRGIEYKDIKTVLRITEPYALEK